MIRFDSGSIFLLAVLRDEYILIEHFIRYYKEIGITHFILIDNGSEDGSLEYLQNLNVNIMLFHTSDSYKDANYGTNWINNLLQKYCKNNWCLVVDIDELVYLNNLNSLICEMKSNNSNLCKFLLLDMYSKRNKNYQKGEKFLKHSHYFDDYSKYYNAHYINGIFTIYGGVRKETSKC